MNLELKFENQEQFITTFLAVLENEGIVLPTGYSLPKAGNINQNVTIQVETPGEATGEVDITEALYRHNIDWITVYPLARDTSGELINEGTLENPSYVLEPGYYVNVISRYDIQFPIEFIIHPRHPQYTWA